jgi:hypothetical protein
MCSRPFETRSRPRSLATTHRGFAFYVAFPKSSIRPLGFAHLCRSRPRGSVHSLLPRQLYLDHSHCPVLAPATLAALPSTRARLKLVPCPAHSPLPIAALPSMSLSPNAPFPRSRRVLCRSSHSLHSPNRVGFEEIALPGLTIMISPGRSWRLVSCRTCC